MYYYKPYNDFFKILALAVWNAINFVVVVIQTLREHLWKTAR